jgi:hypothetical protein
MQRWLVIAVAAGALVAAAVVERRVSDVTSGDVAAAAAKLDRVPREFGDWTSTEVPMDGKVLTVAGAAGHVSRAYANRKKNWRLSVLLLCGPTGPIGAHEPRDCYAGNGYDTGDKPLPRAVGLPGGATATYWSGLFEKKAAAAPDELPLRVCWAWGADGKWEASADPRTEYVTRRALYKLYVSRPEPRASTGPTPADRPKAPDAIETFLTAFLPEVNAALAAPPDGR